MNRLLFKDQRFRQPFFSADYQKVPLLFFRNNRILFKKFRPFRFKGFKVSSVPFKAFQARIVYSLASNKKFFFSRARNRCFLTGNSHSVYRDFRLSRMSLREAILSGKAPFINKSSW